MMSKAGAKRRSLEQRLVRAALLGSALLGTASSCSVYDASLARDGTSGSGGDLGGADSGGGAVSSAGDFSIGGGPVQGGAGGERSAAGDSNAEMAGLGGAPDTLGGAAGASVTIGGAPAGGVGGMPVSAGAGGGATVAGSAGVSGALQELAQGRKVTSSSQQTGNEAVKGNDGDSTSRWCASNSTMPQWWRVDLGASHGLNQVSIRFQIAARNYSYVIETSQNDLVYTQQATVSGTGAVQTVDLPANLSARYVRIKITAATPGSNSDATWASFFEFTLLGS